MKQAPVVFAALLICFLSTGHAQSAASQPAGGLKVRQWLTPDPPDIAGLAGKVRVLEFWASWCPPCIEALGHLTGLHTRYANSGLVPIGLSLDKSAKSARNAIRNKKVSFPLALDKGTADLYQVTHLPTAVILDRNENVLWKGNPLSKEFEQNIVRALGTSSSSARAKTQPPRSSADAAGFTHTNASSYTTRMAKYPIFLELSGQRVVLVGAGNVAFRKAQVLLDAGARLIVIADHIDEIFHSSFAAQNVEFIEAPYSKQYLAEAILVIAATNNRSLNERVYKHCRELGILCNVVDQPQLCDFFVPAVVKRGDLHIALSTDGKCPAYAGHLRKKLEQLITEQHGRFLAELEDLRAKILAEVPEPDQRKALLGRLVDDESFGYFISNGAQKWHNYAERIIAEHSSQTAKNTD